MVQMDCDINVLICMSMTGSVHGLLLSSYIVFYETGQIAGLGCSNQLQEIPENRMTEYPQGWNLSMKDLEIENMSM